MRSLTNFMFFKNTPFTNFQNTVLFKNNNERDDYFINGNHFSTIVFHDTPFNFIRDRQTVRLSISYNAFRGVNYCTFVSDFEPNVRYYAYVVSYTYINDNAIEVNLLIDGIMTFAQGYTLNNFRNLKIERKHMDRIEYEERLVELKNNDDVLQTTTKKYTHHDKILFDELSVLIQSSCDLTADFGDVDNPIIETSEGLTFDGVTSPLNLYVVSQEDFPKFMKALAPFAWISQNLRSISLVPSVLIEGKTVDVPMYTTDFKGLKALRNGQVTNKRPLFEKLTEISKDMPKLYEIFGLDPNEDKHLLRNEYTTSELYTFQGEQLYIDNGQLSERLGLSLLPSFISGFHNEIAIYVNGYKADDSKDANVGAFLNDALYIRNFDDVPLLIDNYNLSLAQSANQRKVAESRLITNRLTSILGSTDSLEDRFYNTVAIASNLSPVALFGQFVDEHEYYKNQQAQQTDLALSSPTITSQSNNNALAISEKFFGLHVKHAQPNQSEWETIKRYYKMFGFHVNDELGTLNVQSNTVCNYVKFSGNIAIDNVDVSILELMKIQFENGVRLWHYDGSSNPMLQDVMENKMR